MTTPTHTQQQTVVLHPNQAKALREHWTGWADRPRCKRCNRVAMRNDPCCWYHTQRDRRPTVQQRARHTLDQMTKLGLVPDQLAGLETYRKLAQLSVRVRAVPQLALVMAWSDQDAEPLKFAKAWREATRLVREHWKQSIANAEHNRVRRNGAKTRERIRKGWVDQGGTRAGPGPRNAWLNSAT